MEPNAPASGRRDLDGLGLRSATARIDSPWFDCAVHDVRGSTARCAMPAALRSPSGPDGLRHAGLVRRHVPAPKAGDAAVAAGRGRGRQICYGPVVVVVVGSVLLTAGAHWVW